VTGVPDDDPVLEAARWCARLVEVLGDVGRRVGQLSEQIGRDWPDGRGREWAERTAQLRSALEREELAATELGEAYARQAAGADGTTPTIPPLAGHGGFAGRRTGVRLGGTDAVRVEDERGMRIAELGPLPPPG
jgi:hypothetical protein